MWHIVQQREMVRRRHRRRQFRGDGADGPAPATVAEILAHYDEHVPRLGRKYCDGFRRATGPPVSFFNVFNFPLVLYMDFWIKHTVHHRGQLSMHLRAMNAHVPDIYGGSADEPFEMPATA